IVAATPDLIAAGYPVVLIEGRFDPVKLQAKVMAEKGWRLKVHEIGKVKVYEISPGSGPNVFLAVDKSLLILAPRKERLAEALEKAAGAKKTELANKAMLKLVDKLDPKEAVSGAAVQEMV